MSATKSQIDRLGERLRTGNVSDDDLKELDMYRRSFAEAYANAIGTVRDVLRLEPTGRPAKSTTSIIEKLQRETIRLSQMQDIAGCRLVVGAVGEQNDAARALSESLTGSVVVDRRSNPSHGYRAVHVIAHLAGRPVEIQVRTSLQHLWAEFSEKLSDLVDSRIKYGLGDAAAVELLKQVSELVSHVERAELVGTVAEIAEHKQDVRKVLELAIRHAADYRRGA